MTTTTTESSAASRRPASWPALRRLDRRMTTVRNSAIREHIDALGLQNVFNPSVTVVADRTLVAFRALAARASSSRFDAHLLSIPRHGAPHHWNLTDHCANFGITVVADPKLVLLDDSVHITFNTGHPGVGQRNALYLMPVAAGPSRPRQCHFAQRRRVEKNWAFFSERGALHAVYELDPVTVLEATDETATTVRFSKRTGDRNGRGAQRALGVRRTHSLGTQPIQDEAGLHMVVHEKFHVRGRRLYLGRAVSVLNPTSRPRIKFSYVRLCGSLRAMFGVPKKHNPNLISATYFSGLSTSAFGLVVSYGINDVDYDIQELQWSDLW